MRKTCSTSRTSIKSRMSSTSSTSWQSSAAFTSVTSITRASSGRLSSMFCCQNVKNIYFRYVHHWDMSGFVVVAKTSQDCNEFRFLIVRIVISVSNVTSPLDCFKNCQIKKKIKNMSKFGKRVYSSMTQGPMGKRLIHWLCEVNGKVRFPDQPMAD